MKIIIFVVLLTIQLSYCVIYRLNETEYLRMPPVFHLDAYESCLYQLNGTYCYVDIDLVSDTPSGLLRMIREYSEHTPAHYNHTQLHYGICLTKTCKHFLPQNETVDLRLTLERCLNDSLWNDYKLKTRLSDKMSCKKLDDPVIINTGDICAAIIFICLALLNVIGSFYEFYFNKSGKGHKILLSFSVKQNLAKLFAYDNKDDLRERLKGIHGIRTLTTMFVILGHSPLPFGINIENTHGMEKLYSVVILGLYLNGTLIVQTFFLMSGCLLAFNTRTYSEQNKLSWDSIPKQILKRWLRLTPAYAMVLIFTLTWIRFMGSGPLWETTVGVETADCHRDGWLNMIYFNNYIDNSQCMVQTWYLAADMQLYILGLFVCVLAKTTKSRNLVLSVLFIIGFVMPPIHTYLQDLNALVLISPENARNFFISDPTFVHSYKRGHTNIPSFVLGLALGNIIYDGLRDEREMQKYKKLRFMYYLTFPTIVAILLSGMVFYQDGPRLSIYIRVIFGALARPLFALTVSIFCIAMVFKYENLYRRIVEWRGWRVPARLSYSAYLIHVVFIRVLAGINTTLLRFGLGQCMKESVGIIFMTFLFAYPFWLFVEAPLNQAIVAILGLSKEEKKEDEDPKHDIDKQIEHSPGSESQYKRNVEINIRL